MSGITGGSNLMGGVYKSTITVIYSPNARGENEASFPQAIREAWLSGKIDTAIRGLGALEYQEPLINGNERKEGHGNLDTEGVIRFPNRETRPDIRDEYRYAYELIILLGLETWIYGKGKTFSATIS